MRRILNLNWRDKVGNDILYKATDSTPCSRTEKLRRLTWYGHLLRLPEDTPARNSLKEANRPCKKFELSESNKDGSLNTAQVKRTRKMAQNRHI